MSLVAGTRLGPYEVLGAIGAGGMGEVYRARDPRLGRDVAIKVLPSEVASDSARLSLFEREGRAVAALNHPNILTVHDVGSHDDTPYVVTELLEGETLRELISRRAPTTQQILTYMLQAARGLEAAHAKGLVHRDLKPENLFLTTDGRVKVLDFGLAKLVRPEAEITSEVSTAAHSTPPGQVAGTVLYMSPEQARAQSIDVRSDVFSFGIVLYELLAGKHPFRKDTLAGTLTAIVEEIPPELESQGRGIVPAVGGIARRCLEKAREDRYASGHDLAVALEAVLAAPSSAAALREVEERSPYPGLSSFTEKDAAVFFGREREVEEVWGRIRSRKLLALIGPSGAGKTSFVRAGVLPARPDGWSVVVSTPGAAPTRHLAQALARQLAGDPEAVQQLLRFDEADVVVETVSLWRKLHGEALLIVDQFEEMLTLNPPEVQDSFASLLGRLATEADVHVLLSLRDDFLIRCCEHEPLVPVLRDLTALLALRPEDLRRAIEEPARKQDYRFEDEALVDEMVESVEGARAALPLLAFAVSRLWERRDREGKVLTRAAYEAIGGVAGALAQHAEQTLERIGSEREEVVREVFRNLVTSQGTRATADREELLSVFPERAAAEQVLGQLIDARLLTSYEPRDGLSPQGSSPGAVSPVETHRIEIVHESLLKAWPRLVRWQAQDEDGALLRDQLKQAAHLWTGKERSPDLLWTGAAYQEFEVWRRRYPGQLTALEDEYAAAMVERSRRRKRRRRAALVAVILGLTLVAMLVSISRHEAVQLARRAEAGKLLALAQLELERDPTGALAYARRSLEVADTAEARRLALKTLWMAPPMLVARHSDAALYSGVAWSADGKRLATGGFTRQVALLADDGRAPTVLGPSQPARWTEDVAFAPDGESVASGNPTASQLRFWSIATGEQTQTAEVGRGTFFEYRGGRLFTLTSRSPDLSGPWSVRVWQPDEGTFADLGSCPSVACDVDTTGQWLAYGRGADVFVAPLPAPGREGRRAGASHGAPVIRVSFAPDGKTLVSQDAAGEARLWSFDDGAIELERTLRRSGTGALGELEMDWQGERVGWASPDEVTVYVRHLTDPPGVRALALRRSEALLEGHAFDPLGRWLATTYRRDVAFWSLRSPYSRILTGQTGTPIYDLTFSPDSEWLASSAFTGATRLWRVRPGTAGRLPRGAPHFDIGSAWSWSLVFTPDGKGLLMGVDPLELHSVESNKRVKVFEGGPPDALLGGRAFDPTGRLVAAAPGYSPRRESLVLQVWEIESGRSRTIPLPKPREGGLIEGTIRDLAFGPDGTLYSAGSDSVRRWDLENETNEVLLEANMSRLDLSGDGRILLAGTRLAEAERTGVSDYGGTVDDLSILDLHRGRSERIRTHGTSIRSLALGPRGQIVVTGGHDSIVRVGLATGEEPHLLLGHETRVSAVAVSPDGRWIASGAGNEIRLWPMPDLSKPPLHTLPHDELVATLRSLTNVEVVEDQASPTGYRLDVGPFPGWREVPEW